MKCPHCDAEVAEESVFCNQCGGKLDGEQPPVDPLVTPKPQGPPALEPSDPRTRFEQAAEEKQMDDVDQEEEIWAGSYSKKGMLGHWIVAILATVGLPILSLIFLSLGSGWIWLLGGLAVMWLVLVLLYCTRRFGVHYTLTDQRFLHEKGLLWRQTDRIELIDIDDVTFKQGPLERLFGVGTIHIASSDKTDPEIDLPGIDDVKGVASLIDDYRRKERRKRGLHIEAV